MKRREVEREIRQWSSDSKIKQSGDIMVTIVIASSLAEEK